MKVPLSWLKEYVEINVPVAELAHRLTMAGTEVASVSTIGGWTNCYVGFVSDVVQHPNADRLTLCTVDTGEKQMQVVCGAPNVAKGQKIAFAEVGAELFNTHSGKVEPLKAAKIRGVVSEGMICSEQELRIGDDHTGILVLPEDAPVGAPLSDYMGDHVLDLEVTPNRPDCLSMLGVAREVAAVTSTSVHEPEASYPEEGSPIGSQVNVEVADPDLCPRYTASLITGLQVEPSPRWFQDRLIKAGLRPINNVVDVTNYVMLEYNQPLHAFDYTTMKENKIVVRRAKTGEVLTTLDGVERKLSTSMLVIADAKDPVGLAGVIGGANSEMTEGTTAVLLESANFNPANNRHTAQTFKLLTEATIRFEKGLRPELALIALKRATKLIHEIAGGAVAKDIVDVFPGEGQSIAELVLTTARLKKVLGVGFSVDKIKQALESLGFTCHVTSSESIKVTLPYWRSDITIEDDLVEEVARIVGYDEIPTTTISTPIPQYRPQPLQDLRERVKDNLAACGMQEVITYPVTSLEDLARVKAFDNGPMPLKLSNPMNSQQECLRTTLDSSLLSTVAANRAYDSGPISIFESGRVFFPKEDDLPEEKELVAAVLSGPRWNDHRLAEGGSLGFDDAKGIIEILLGKLGVTATFVAAQEPYLHPGKCARIICDGVVLGRIGEVHPSVVESFGLGEETVATFELDLAHLLSALLKHERRYTPLPRYPAATRDLSILVDDDIPADKLQQIIASERLITNVVLFDIYTGENIPPKKRSLAYHLYFQSLEKTLTAEEVNGALLAVTSSLQKEVGAELRG